MYTVTNGVHQGGVCRDADSVCRTLLYIPSAVFLLLRKHPLPPGVHVGVNVIALIKLPIYWLIAIAVFTLGFYWQFHRT
jgi:hypothetical protein